ncbi:MAG: hypothetical protein K8S27_02570 [Candidatus Omnitrophica bacterium]|nr:hypothetical protein [Candidatus Omnitrophota bacterium]
MRQTVSVITGIVLTVALGSTLCLAQSQQFQITVTIPLIPGVNGPGLPVELADGILPENINPDVKKLELVKETVWRENQEFVLHTITEK